MRLVGTGGMNGLDMYRLIEEVRARGLVLED